jgi:hypothetical protein
LETPKTNQNQDNVSQYTTCNDKFSSPASNLTQEAFFSIINQVNTIKDTVLFKSANSNGSSGSSTMEEHYQAKLTSLQKEKVTIEQKERETYKGMYLFFFYTTRYEQLKEEREKHNVLEEKLRVKEFEFGRDLACAQSRLKTATTDIQKLTETSSTYQEAMKSKQ